MNIPAAIRRDANQKQFAGGTLFENESDGGVRVHCAISRSNVSADVPSRFGGVNDARGKS